MQAPAHQALEPAFGYAHRLGCADALATVDALLADGTGADRQRRAFAAGGMPAVLDRLVAETSVAPGSSPAKARPRTGAPGPSSPSGWAMAPRGSTCR
jgi:hypothetical protein